jgi:hypothetical protein
VRLLPWEQQLSTWCATPSHWVEPSTLPEFGHVSLKVGAEDAIYEWRKVITLMLSALGSTVIPSTTTPSLITSHVFVIARPTLAGGQCLTLQIRRRLRRRRGHARFGVAIHRKHPCLHSRALYPTCALPPGTGAGAADEQPAEQRFGVA